MAGRVAAEFDRGARAIKALAPLREIDFDAWERSYREVSRQQLQRLRRLMKLPPGPEGNAAESAHAKGQSFETGRFSGGTPLAGPPAVTIEELERRMEAGFKDLEAKITGKITAEGIDTRRHFDIMVERAEGHVKMVAEGFDAHGNTLEDHERRITTLEHP